MRLGLAGLPGTRAGVLLGLSLATIISQFFRSSVAVIAPELITDLALSPRMLGLAGGIFFLALGFSQVPVGMSFDRIGPRFTLAWASVFAFVGAMGVAMAATGPQLIAGRFLLGLGCGASFISAVMLLTRWYPFDRIATMYGRIFAISQIGNFMAATPLAWMSQAVGWRTVFWGSAAAVLVVVAFFVWAVRDQPPGQPPALRRTETLWQTLRGFAEVFRLPGYRKVVAVHTVAYAVMATVLGLWAGPYLHDVHGLDGIARGNVLLAMVMAQVAGMLVLPPLERRFDSRQRVIVAAACSVIATLLALALLPAPPLWLAVVLLVLVCGGSTYSPIIIAHAAALTPVHLRGRSSAAANLGQVSGSFLLPVVSGVIAGLFDQTAAGYPPIAYRLIFGFLAVALALGVLVYSRARDLRPSAGAA
ncbi:MAG: MFS transporter [Burkholderiales bacterium]|nr:MFS transporter [Burkholderiales bacterium]